jgi:hypothetical protein
MFNELTLNLFLMMSLNNVNCKGIANIILNINIRIIWEKLTLNKFKFEDPIVFNIANFFVGQH